MDQALPHFSVLVLHPFSPRAFRLSADPQTLVLQVQMLDKGTE
jgi:hypothetical protein